MWGSASGDAAAECRVPHLDRASSGFGKLPMRDLIALAPPEAEPAAKALSPAG